jgi:uncharacterized protein YbjT (DUF2867 family)
MENKTALILGASGLVGQGLAKILIDSPEYSEVTLLVRKKLNIDSKKIHQEKVDFDDLENYYSFFNVDSVFCCLGTTIKIAKTKENFMKVDLEYPVKSAKLTKEAGKGSFFVISAMGSNEKSKVFYNEVKGRLEKQLIEMNLGTLHIFKPSMLTGDRKEFRLGEKVALTLSKIMSFVFIGSLKKYKPIKVRQVALAMYKASLKLGKGTYVHESDEMLSI